MSLRNTKEPALPVLVLKLWVRNPDPVARKKEYYTESDVTCEVLTVHLATNAMRVRFKWLQKWDTRNLEATEFLTISLLYLNPEYRMLDWKYFRDEKPPFDVDILWIPSPKFGLLFALVTIMTNSDRDGDHFIGIRNFKVYTDEMWAMVEPPQI